MRDGETVLLWGLPADPPLATVRNALQHSHHRVMLLDQRDVLETSVELVAGSAVEGHLRVRDQVLDLAAVKAAYLRPQDPSEFPAIAEAGPQSEAWRHAHAVHDVLFSWADLTPALVLNRPAAMAPNYSKPYQAKWIESLGFHIPDTLITTDPGAARDFWRQHETVIYKSLSGIRSVVSRLTADHLQRFEHIASCPTQFQQYIPGTEYRVHLVGERFFSCEILSEADDYRYGATPAAMRPCELPVDLAALCRTIAKSMDLPLAGIDLRRTPDDRWYCLEVNPSPSFTWFQDVTDQPIAEAVAQLLMSGRPGQ
jgi:hypothetical protein